MNFLWLWFLAGFRIFHIPFITSKMAKPHRFRGLNFWGQIGLQRQGGQIKTNRDTRSVLFRKCHSFGREDYLFSSFQEDAVDQDSTNPSHNLGIQIWMSESHWLFSKHCPGCFQSSFNHLQVVGHQFSLGSLFSCFLGRIYLLSGGIWVRAGGSLLTENPNRIKLYST